MKFLFFIFIFTIICCHFEMIAQFGAQQIITQTANGTKCIIAADIDGDGNIDIASANEFGSNLTWYKNLDGDGTFGPENLIANLNQTFWISDADIDGDGDMDVMAVSFVQDKIVWYENLDGQGNFGAQNIVDDNADGAYAVVAGDLDGDGDLDLIAAIDLAGTVAWYENLDGQGDFFKHLIDNNLSGPRSIVAIDVDGDDDLDIVGNSTAPNKTYWVENVDGLGTFGAPNSIYEMGQYVTYLFAADVDGDGDIDVITASSGDNEVAWFENLNSLGNFGPKNTITNTLVDAWRVYAADLDNDGDMDVLATSAEPFGGEIVWFENLDGQGNFSAKKTISTQVQSPRSVIAADIDDDGDLDVIASSLVDDTIAWYENFTILGIEENDSSSFKIYPNPTKGLVFIDSKNENILSASVFDILGKKVIQLTRNIQQLDISNLQSGVYFLRLATQNGDLVQKIIKE